MNIIYPEKQILSQLASEDFEMESKWEGTPLSIWFPKFHTDNGNGIGIVLEFKIWFIGSVKWN